VTDVLGLGAARIHCVGVGGAGVYPIVQILKELGYNVSGSDIEDGDTLERIRGLGVKVFVGHNQQNITGAGLLVFSSAVPAETPELVAAETAGLKILSRAEMLQLITAKFSQSICVAGTHGKTTTTALLTQMLLENDVNAGAIIGGVLPMINGAGRVGDFSVCVCEACEYANTFLSLTPTVSVVLNIDNDHLEFFGSMKNLIDAFKEFLNKTKRLVIYNGDDENTNQAVLGLQVPKVSFGLKESNDYYAANIKMLSFEHTCFDLFKRGERVATFTSAIPGEHNIYNLIAANVAAIEFGLSPDKLKDATFNFKGAERRFQVLYRVNDVVVVDDYAHHPAEIKAALATARHAGYKNVWAIFQPFTYSRTKMLLDDFADVLALADHCVITDIMGSREFNVSGISAADLAKKNQKFIYVGRFNDVVDYIKRKVPANTLIITLGCGNIYKVGKLLVKELEGKH
jgi:UDP-N-acetylmuramate--alanine ligase